VAIGIALDAFYASRMKWISDDDLARVVKGFLDCGLTLWCEELKQRRADGRLEILDGLDLFREHLGGELTLAMPDGIGAIRNIHVMDTALVEEGVCFLRNMVYPEQSADNRKNELC
jgi:3-dehydroquinate synthase